MEIKHIPHLKESKNEKSFGFDENQNESFIYEIANSKGMKLSACNYGATVISLQIPINGNSIDVVLGFDKLQDYIDSFRLPSAPYLGATVGRYAGRIGKAQFRLGGKTVNLDKNNGDNSLHGGHHGLSRATWKLQELTQNTVTFSHISPHGEDGYPGELAIRLTYSLSENNEFIVEYAASADADTIINLTHHSYFNLDGHCENVAGQRLSVNADQFLETDSGNVPTGNFTNVENSNFDFRLPKDCPAAIDNTFVLHKNEIAATLYSPKNSLQMDVYTNQPGLHIYVGGNCFNEIRGKENAAYHPLSGICFETQNYPDAPNHDHFPGAILKKGETYRHKTTYHFKNI